MKKAKAAKKSNSWLYQQFQKALVEGYKLPNSRSDKRPFTIRKNRLGGIRLDFALQAAFDELITFFVVALFAREDKLNGRTLESYTDDEARTMLARHTEERNKYVPLVLALLDEQIEQKLEEALEELYSEVKWQALHRLGFPIDSDDLKRIFQRASNRTKRRIDAPGAGRKKGSRTIKTSEEKLREQAEFEEQAIEAIMRLYPADNHHKPLKKYVAEELEISVRTLTRKTKPSVGKSFEELVEIAEMRQRN